MHKILPFIYRSPLQKTYTFPGNPGNDRKLFFRWKQPNLLQILASTRDTELKLLINLFSALVDAYRESRREIGLILENKKTTLGVIIDEIVSVEKLMEEELIVADTLGLAQSIYIGKRKDNSPVIILDDDYFFKLCMNSASL
jgi:hypothetical protein